MDASLAVVGGGPVGATLGLLVPGAVVLDRDSFPRDKPCGEGLLPDGVGALREAGIDLAEEGFPAINGVTYRLAGGACARSDFAGGPGRGVRRLRLDALLAERAGVVNGCRVRGLRSVPGGLELDTAQGVLGAEAVVLAEGLRSPLARSLGWAGKGSPGERFGLVGHLQAPAGSADIQVTLLGDLETYLAPVGEGELLVAVLADRRVLRSSGPGLEQRYRWAVGRAHPELSSAPLRGRIWGAGPFRHRPKTVARGRLFLAGDAAGFVDPLTGDGISAGLQQAVVLARLLGDGLRWAAPRYRRWWSAQWRRRRAVGWLARSLSQDLPRARGAVQGLARRPQALQGLMELNQGTSGWTALGLSDWSALLGRPGR